MRQMHGRDSLFHEKSFRLDYLHFVIILTTIAFLVYIDALQHL